MLSFLNKGVQMHSFSDRSGCVFLDLHSGETLSVLMSEDELVTMFSGETISGESDVQRTVVNSLIQKNILIPLDIDV